MYCQNRISYRVQEGDSLYKLAKQFHTTVTELILLNSGVNPYNLQTGMRLTICPGEGYVDENESKPSEGNTNKPTKTPVGGIVIIHARELRYSREAQHARELRHSRELQHAREPQRSRETTWAWICDSACAWHGSIILHL